MGLEAALSVTFDCDCPRSSWSEFASYITNMKSILSLVAVAALTSSASSQIFSEDFSSGTPPTGWTIIDGAGAGVIGWEPGIFDPYYGVDHTGWAQHDYDSLLPADTLLVSPVIDLSSSSMSTLTFMTETQWVDYMAHSAYSLSNGVSTAEVSTDGGVTWTVVWTDGVLLDFTPVTAAIDLSAFDGMSNVQVGFRYFGTDAHAWWIDDVVVDRGPGPAYSIAGLMGGSTATLAIDGATPGGVILIGYSLAGAGPTMTPYGPVDISAPISQLPALTADPIGHASLSTGVPGRATGFTFYSQAADLTTGILSNSLAEPIL